MNYFDFHCHTIFKQVFAESPGIDSFMNQSDVNTIVQLCTDVPYIIQSQMHQTQLAEFSNETIVGAALYALEKSIADEVAALRGLLKKPARAKLSAQLLSDVSANKCRAFSDFVVERTLDFYLKAPLSFNILTKKSFKNVLPHGKINVFFTIEGCHSLVDSTNRFIPGASKFPPDEILSNLDILLKKIAIVSVNLTHMQQSNLCNHAFGIQLTKAEPFFPRGNGLTADGEKVVQGLFDRRICVDFKHMSYKARRDLRVAIDTDKFRQVQPVVCTHAGFTGIPFSQWADYIALKKAVGDQFYIEIAKSMHTANEPVRPGAPAFNSATINLFDEEISWIVSNGGMIGLSMDRRILGYIGKFDERPTGIRGEASALIVDKEYISQTEWAALGTDKIGGAVKAEDCVTLADLEESAEGSIPARNEYFYDHILLHIKHYFQVCMDAGIPLETAQKHICIGSDFDGLINPFINVQTVEEMQDVKKYISANLGYYLKSLKDSKKWAARLPVALFTEDLFYNNGYHFLKQRLS